MGKLTVIILGIAVPIVVIAVMLPIFMNGLSNLQQTNQDKENSKPMFVSLFSEVIGNCTGTTGITLDRCKQSIDSLQSQCSFYDNPSVCSDPRIDEIMTSTAQTVLSTPSTNFVTYNNNQFGFSIDYPSNWVIDDNLPDGNIGIKDKMTAGNVLFEIKQMQSNGNSFDYMVSNYVSHAGAVNSNNYPITLQSQDKVTVGNKDGYRLQYTQTIGDTTCKDEDFLINEGQVVPVISYNSCDADIFNQFQPTFEKVAYTFR